MGSTPFGRAIILLFGGICDIYKASYWGSCYVDFSIIYIFAESVDIDISRDTIMSTIVMLCHLWYN